MKNKPPKDASITFVNNEGHAIRLNEKMPLKELLKMGVTSIKIVTPSAPLKKNEYRNL